MAAAAAAIPAFGKFEYQDPVASLSKLRDVLDILSFKENVSKEAKALKEKADALYKPVAELFHQKRFRTLNDKENKSLEDLQTFLHGQAETINDLIKHCFDLLSHASTIHGESALVFGIPARSLEDTRVRNINFVRQSSDQAIQFLGNEGFQNVVTYNCCLFLGFNATYINLSKTKPTNEEYVETFMNPGTSIPSFNAETVNNLNEQFRKFGPNDIVYIDCTNGVFVDRILVYKRA